MSVPSLRVAIVGLGTAGAALAVLLDGRGHEVTVFEREAEPGPAGAGIWLQHLGQQVLDRIGLLDELRAVSRPVSRIHGRTMAGRVVMDFSYDAVPGAPAALGVHRGQLFGLLHRAVSASGTRLRPGVAVSGVRPDDRGRGRTEMVLESPAGDLGSFDLVVGADGSRSRVRRCMNVTVRDRAYEYGALWAVVRDPERIAEDELYQCFRGTRSYLGVLPTGERQASVFWSAKVSEMAAARAGGVDAWRELARPFAGRYEPLLDSVEELLPAVYRDVAVRRPYRMAGDAGAVLVGDSAHAMSPQLGTGTSLALADAWGLHRALATSGTLAEALAAHAADRAAHVRWYQWWTRLMMPAFQSDLVPLAWPRDLVGGALTTVPAVRRQLVTTLLGDRTSPWSHWSTQDV